VRGQIKNSILCNQADLALICLTLQQHTKTKVKVTFGIFKHHSTLKTQWITGLSKLMKLFCWPCLLFASEQSVWANSGYDNLINLHNAIQEHEKSSHTFRRS
jgi:hypothetical protein